ncbi:MAG: sulfotransferase family protein [Nitrosarchaeum sp.]
MEIQKPIFIIGVPRTGTTLLYNILCMHQDLAWFSIENFSSWVNEDEKELMKNHFLEIKNNNKIPVTEESIFVFGADWKPGIIQTRVHPDLKKTPIEGEYFWRKQFGDKYTRNISDEKKREIILELKNVIKEQQKSRFLSKAPQNTMRLFAIQEIFPDAKFVNVVRDPRPVVSSMLERVKKEGTWDPGIEILDKERSKKLDLIGQFAWRYKEITDEIYKFAKENKRNFITIKYEDLISKSEEIIIKVLKFCELDMPKNFHKMIPEIREHKESFKNNLTSKQQKMIFRLVEKSMKRMNYSYKQDLRFWFIRKFM